jgi:hypothetical protein
MSSEPRKEHNYNGACYGLCGEFVPPADEGLDKKLTDYWHAHYVKADVCGLCGNRGVLDTRGRAYSPRGQPVGGLFWCICPNGQTIRQQTGTEGPRDEQS